MPLASGHSHPADLPLCNHHYQIGRVALRAIGATVFIVNAVSFSLSGGIGHDGALGARLTS